MDTIFNLRVTTNGSTAYREANEPMLWDLVREAEAHPGDQVQILMINGQHVPADIGKVV